MICCLGPLLGKLSLSQRGGHKGEDREEAAPVKKQTGTWSPTRAPGPDLQGAQEDEQHHSTSPSKAREQVGQAAVGCAPHQGAAWPPGCSSCHSEEGTSQR